METWTTRETFSVRIETLPAATGLDESDVQRALRSLSTANPPYLVGIAAQLTYPMIITEVTERARRAVGQWPASDQAADVFLAALTEAAEQEADEEKRSVLRRVATALGGVGKDVLIRVMTQIGAQEATQHLPPHI
jgi:hypothetical protein